MAFCIIFAILRPTKKMNDSFARFEGGKNNRRNLNKMSTIKKPTNNPLTDKPTHKFDVPPLDKIKSEHFIPAIDWALSMAHQRIDEIKAQKNPTFENVIEALENASPESTYVSGVFSNFSSVAIDDEMLKIEGPISEKYSAYGNAIMMDADLFKQVKAVYDQKDSLNLNAEQTHLLNETYKGFVKSGGLLNTADKKKLAQVNIDLSKATTDFGQNVQNATNNFELVIDDVAMLDGMPQTAQDAAAEAANAKGYNGKYLLTLQAPSVIPVLSYATNRDLREKIWRAFTRRGTEAGTDNRPVVKNILELRHQKAELLGYDCYADYILEERMAKNTETVFDMIEGFKDKVSDTAKEEMKTLSAFAKKCDGITELKPWDNSFYGQKLKKDTFGFDSEDLKLYLEFNKVAQGAFDVATKMYNIDFNQSDDYPKYHDDTETYEVVDKTSGEVLAVLYTDFFPRESKRGGAWMNTYRKQSYDENGKRVPPIVCIHGNFSKATANTPSLLTMDEATTFFHEFGHGLHGILSDTQYSSNASPDVKWDFVELPSQLMENWAKEKEVLATYAKHYKTGEVIPDDLVDKMIAAENFQIASFYMRQLQFGHMDMKYHTTNPDQISDIEKFETDVTKDFQILDKEGACQSASFGHLFAGGYAAGYYSYKWAEVLEADAFEAFKENGLFDKATADKFRKLLSSGGAVDPSKLYKDFRGQDPDQNALLRRDGILKTPKK